MRADIASSAKLLPSDIISIQGGALPTMPTLKHRVQHPPLVGLLDICSKTIYGMSSRGTPQFLFYPINSSYPPFLVGYAGQRTDNKMVIIRFVDWGPSDKFPRGSLERVIGSAGDLLVEKEALILSACPWREVKLDSTFAVNHNTIIDHGWRTFNIDPAGCRDIDDVFSYRPLELNRPGACDGVYEIAISIADVASVVEEGSVIDMAACERGQTLYHNGSAVKSMLPQLISENKCSLIVGEPRNCVSLVFEIDIYSGKYENVRFTRMTLINNKTYTYDEFDEVTEATEATSDKAILTACCNIIGSDHAADSHSLIETLMIFYNKEAAKQLWRARTGLLRAHSAAENETLKKMVDLHPDLTFMAMESAKYVQPSDVLATHSMFPGAAYCHATSPIRRYADLVNQRALLNVSGHKDKQSLSFIEYHLNTRSAVAKRFERDMFFLEMLYKGGGSGLEGICIDINNEGTKIKVYVPEWRRVVTIRDYDGAIVGDKILISYWFDPSQAKWKNKIVFRVDDLIV